MASKERTGSRQAIEVRVELKRGILDPEAEAVRKALDLLGIKGLESVAMSRSYTLEFSHADPQEARRRAEASVERLLANPIIHRVSIHAVASGARR